MSVMACGYMAMLDGFHWTTQAPFRATTYATFAVLTAAAWAVYFYLKDFEVFAALFTLQVVASELTSYAGATCASARAQHLAVPKVASGADLAAAAPLTAASRWWWWAGLGSILAGKALWEWERALYRGRACPASEADPRFWLHPAWHVLGAAAHHCWTTYVVVALRPRFHGEEGHRAKEA
jgi:hypothetical protein